MLEIYLFFTPRGRENERSDDGNPTRPVCLQFSTRPCNISTQKKKKKQPSLLKDRVQARSSRFTLYMWRNHPQLLCPSLVIPRGRNKRRNERLSFLTRHVLQKASISHLFRSQRAQEELRSVPSLRPRLSRNLSSVILWCNFRAGFCATKRVFFFFFPRHTELKSSISVGHSLPGTSPTTPVVLCQEAYFRHNLLFKAVYLSLSVLNYSTGSA